MEHLLLKVLTFDLAAPTILNFLDRYVTVAGANERTEHLAKVCNARNFVVQVTGCDLLRSHCWRVLFSIWRNCLSWMVIRISNIRRL